MLERDPFHLSFLNSSPIVLFQLCLDTESITVQLLSLAFVLFRFTNVKTAFCVGVAMLSSFSVMNAKAKDQMQQDF